MNARVGLSIVAFTTFVLLLISEISPSGISAMKFKRAVPPVIMTDRDALTLGNYQINSKIDCALKCSSITGCRSFLFKASADRQQQNCVNTTTPQGYAGTISVSYNGIPCERNWDTPNNWRHLYNDSSFPEGSVTGAKSYCRDPVPYGSLWCLVSSADWIRCNIPRCMTGNCRLFSKSFNSNELRSPIEDMEFYYEPETTP